MSIPPSDSQYKQVSYKGLFLIMHVLFSTFADCDGDTLNHALVQYTFDEEEHAITLGPHGNAKKGSTYLRTLPSTLQKLRKVSQNLTPKFAVLKCHPLLEVS